eukprot:3119835-Rhodomonas_salina.1
MERTMTIWNCVLRAVSSWCLLAAAQTSAPDHRRARTGRRKGHLHSEDLACSHSARLTFRPRFIAWHHVRK